MFGSRSSKSEEALFAVLCGLAALSYFASEAGCRATRKAGGSFARTVLISGALTATVMYGGYTLVNQHHAAAKYEHAYTAAEHLADKDGNGTLDTTEFAELYRRAGVEPATYDAKKHEMKQSKLTLGDLEKAIASYKQ